MKKNNFIIVLAVMLFSLIVFQSSSAQDNSKLKDHVCTSACKDGCKLVHGEKGHVCTDDCKK